MAIKYLKFTHSFTATFTAGSKDPVVTYPLPDSAYKRIPMHETSGVWNYLMCGVWIPGNIKCYKEIWDFSNTYIYNTMDHESGNYFRDIDQHHNTNVDPTSNITHYESPIYEGGDYWPYPSQESGRYYIPCSLVMLRQVAPSESGTTTITFSHIFIFDNDDESYDALLAAYPNNVTPWYPPPSETDWIIDDDLPYKLIFPTRSTSFDGYPTSLWNIDDDIPYKSVFAEMFSINEAPSAMWLIDDDLPYKSSFSEIHSINDAPYVLWEIDEAGELPRKWMFAYMYSIDWYPPTTSWLQFAGYIPYRPWPGKVSIPNIIEAVELPEIDWTRSMQQTFEYYTVDPRTWYDQRRLDQVMSSNHSIDLTSEMRGNATLNTTEQLPESYIRTYMRCKQDGIEQRVCLGTYLYMTSQCQFDGIKNNYTMTGYTPLVELQESLPPLGYFIYGKVKKGSEAPLITEEIRKAIVNNTRCELEMNVQIAKPLLNNFVAGTDDNWLTVVNNLLSASNEAKYMLTVDEWGSLQLKNSPSVSSMQPKFVYDDGNASVLLPSVDTSDDLFSIPNVVELIFVGNTRYRPCRVIVKNEDESSPVSVQNRGREITKRYTINNIAIPTTSNPTEEVIRELVTSQAYTLLETLSTVQKTISYSHGYCGTKVGDCVMINYVRAGLENIKAVITSQKINCTPGCQVDETAVYTKKYWRRSDGNAAND